jgi:hypothetical protein
MPSLINMQQSAEEAKEYTEPSVADAPKYPWGLCITLDDDSLEKLGVKTLPTVETVVTIVAKATVSRISENQTQGGESERSMDLQITDLQIDGLDADLLGRAAEMLYGKK